MNKAVLENIRIRIEMMNRYITDIERLYRLSGNNFKSDICKIFLNINVADVDEDEFCVLQQIEEMRGELDNLHALSIAQLARPIALRYKESEGEELTRTDLKKGLFLALSPGAQPEDVPVLDEGKFDLNLCVPVKPEFEIVSLAKKIFKIDATMPG